MPFDPLDEDRVARASDLLWNGYHKYLKAFEYITERAAERFEQRNWKGMRQDTVRRLDLYPKVVKTTCRKMDGLLGSHARNPDLWSAIKASFFSRAAHRHDAELAFTFYNSINRRILQTVGIDPELEFLAPQPTADAAHNHAPLTFSVETRQVTEHAVAEVLDHFDFRTPFADRAADERLCAQRIEHSLPPPAGGHLDRLLRIEMITTPFFREMGAYLIGRICFEARQMPLVFALGNSEKGLYVDALLLRQDEIRILFSFSHTYFHVQTGCPHQLVRFLKELMPTKRTAELYIGLGYNKHGKTELYRDLLEHQKACSLDRFDFAPGQHGMVIIAFNMPRDDLIYKLIRDRFASPKHATRQQVMEKYDYVFRHDRAGRLIDVQTFENLEIEDCCFSADLVDEIKTGARRTATVEENRVILHHVYVERRLIPLDLYLKQADAADAQAAVIDYGMAIKDLARINVFPGDMLLKNFGVTQLGRVIFYDYDELCPLTDCHFRRLPQAREYEDELASEPWYMVEDNDVFPEEFARFLAMPPDLKQIFLKHHSDLLTPEFWIDTQLQIRSGALPPILPYGRTQKLRPS
jgi:isocitrate dehydrogenase kinase/phosphatase